MSIFLRKSKDGKVSAAVYVVADAVGETILGTFETVNAASKFKEASISERPSSSYDIFNITHGSSPRWLLDSVHADPEYCEFRAMEAEKMAEGYRKKAQEMMEWANAADQRAEIWRSYHRTNNTPKPVENGPPSRFQI